VFGMKGKEKRGFSSKWGNGHYSARVVTQADAEWWCGIRLIICGCLCASVLRSPQLVGMGVNRS
jgi:hypothetical protein